jgi:hypothetical protein
MTWHQHQQCPGMSPPDNLLRLEEDLLLTAMRAPSHPHGTRWRIKLAQPPAPLAYVLRNAEIEFDVARHMGAIRIGAQRFEAVRICLALGSNDNSPGQRVPEQRAQPLVAADRAGGNPRAGQHQRNPPPAALVIQVRPQLSLENDRRTRLNPVEEPPHGARQIKGYVAHVCEILEQGFRARGACRRKRRDYNRNSRIALAQCRHESSRSLHLAHRHSVDPDAARRQLLAKSKPLPEVRPIAAVAKPTP